MAEAAEERLVVALEARIRDFEKNMARAKKVANDNLAGIEKRAQAMAPRLQAALTRASSGLAGTFAKVLAVGGVGLGAREVIAFADAWTRANNALKVAGLSGEDLKGTLSQLFDAAQRQGAPLEALVTLYGRASQSANELGASNGDLIRFSEDVAIALRVAGTSSQEASGALLQLGQLLGSSRVQAEEFNSVGEAARPILQAVANGLKEAGGNVSKLKALVSDGQVSNVAFFKAFQVGAEGLRQQAAAADDTVAMAFERVSNAITRAVGELDKTTGVSRNAATNLGHVAEAIGRIPAAVDMAAGKLAELQTWLNQAGNSSFWVKFGKLMGVKFTAEEAAANGLTLVPMNGGKSTGGGIGSDARMPVDTSKPPVAGPNPLPNAISACDYPVVGGKVKGGGAGGSKVDHFNQEVEGLNRQTEALRLETEMLGKSTYAAEKARAMQALLSAAKQQYGTNISPQLQEQIEREADAYASAADKFEQVKDRQEQVNDLQQELGSIASSTFSGLIKGTQSWGDALANIADRLVDLALQASLLGTGPLAGILGGGLGGGGGAAGGLVGALFKGFGFAEGGVMTPQGPRRIKRYASGGVSSTAAIFGEAGPEAAVPLPDGRRIPVDLKMPGAAASRPQRTTMNANISISLAGANGDAAIAQAAREAAAAGAAIALRQVPGMAVSSVADAQRRR